MYLDHPRGKKWCVLIKDKPIAFYKTREDCFKFIEGQVGNGLEYVIDKCLKKYPHKPDCLCKECLLPQYGETEEARLERAESVKTSRMLQRSKELEDYIMTLRWGFEWRKNLLSERI
jgi:hypothetical protein